MVESKKVVADIKAKANTVFVETRNKVEADVASTAKKAASVANTVFVEARNNVEAKVVGVATSNHPVWEVVAVTAAVIVVLLVTGYFIF
jgi:hypothetical protein